LKFGLYLPNFGAFGEARLLAELAHDAEQAGWAGFFIWDHIARPIVTPLADAWVALSAIAMNTKTIRTGALVTPLPRRRPWKVARESVSIDRLSNGRLVLGVGLGSSGGQEVEWGKFGEETDLKTRGAMLDEGLEVVCGLWSGEPFAFDGQHYRVKESRFIPTPHQTPRIPVWVAGNWPHHAPFRRAARWDGMIPQSASKGVDELAQLKQAIRYTLDYRQTLRVSETQRVLPFDVVFSGATPGGDPARARAQVEPFGQAGVTWWLEQIYPVHFGGRWEGVWPLEAMRERVLQGPPSK
jgi:alkanesulfonate monooxygenase SsuD/methylene tetrahydromethanopterin reductase-like flavin-dependent oxidoreductase (luciferase family)